MLRFDFLSGISPKQLCLLFLTVCIIHPSDCQVENYVVDTLVVMDTPAFNKWLNRESGNPSSKRTMATRRVQEYMSFVIREANLRLASLTDQTNQWTLQLSITDFHIDANPLLPIVQPETGAVPSQEALRQLSFWLIANRYNADYDYVILFTGYDLAGTGNEGYDIKGIANVGSLCNTDGSSSAVVVDKGGFQSVHFVAHELGHSLGSKHDGESPNTACPESDRYLMSIREQKVRSLNKINPWYFSSCSKQVIGSYLAQNLLKDHPSCLRDSQTPAPEYNVTKGVFGGEAYDPNQQCQQLYGPNSRLCLGDNFSLLEDVCTSMFCLDPSIGTFVCREHRAAEWTSCADGKTCHLGRCTENPFAPNVTNLSDACAFGDSVVAVEGKYTCSQYAEAIPQACYDHNFQSACCGTCGKLKKPSKVCPYGDKRTGCGVDLCHHIDVDGTRFEELCCGTCSYDVIQRCVDVDQIDGMTCDRRVARDAIQGCYNTSVAYHCCKTCQNIRTQNKGCEYGDRTLDRTCRSLITSNQSCIKHSRQCCETCGQLDLNGAISHHDSSHIWIWLAAFVVYCRIPWFYCS